MLLQPSSETPTDIRRQNRYTVLSLLRNYKILSRSDLARLTELANPTIGSILDALVEETLVQLVEDGDGNRLETMRGRPAAQYRLNTETWLAAGLQIASNSLTALLMRLDGTVVDSERVPAPSDMPHEVVLETATTLIQSLLARSGQGQQLLGLGLAVEGLVDAQNGLSLVMPYRADWDNVPIAAVLGERFGVPVVADWRVYTAALAEATYGAARGISDFAYINVDTGVAVASVASGTLVRNDTTPAGTTGDLSHIPFVGGTRLCYCGSTGCLQTEITTPALLAQLEDMIRSSVSGKRDSFWQTNEPSLDNLLRAAREGDPVALQLQARLAPTFAFVARAAIFLFSANLVILGGPVVQFVGEEAVTVARQAAQRLGLIHPIYRSTTIVASELQPDSATVGAATLIIQAILDGRITVPTDLTNTQEKG